MGEARPENIMAKHYGKTLWGNIMGRHYGETLWGNIMGKHYGRTLWANIMGNIKGVLSCGQSKHYGKTLWATRCFLTYPLMFSIMFSIMFRSPPRCRQHSLHPRGQAPEVGRALVPEAPEVGRGPGPRGGEAAEVGRALAQRWGEPQWWGGPWPTRMAVQATLLFLGPGWIPKFPISALPPSLVTGLDYHQIS